MFLYMCIYSTDDNHRSRISFDHLNMCPFVPHQRETSSIPTVGESVPLGCGLLVMSTVYQYCKQLNGEKEGSRVLAACISDSTRTKKVIQICAYI